MANIPQLVGFINVLGVLSEVLREEGPLVGAIHIPAFTEMVPPFSKKEKKCAPFSSQIQRITNVFLLVQQLIHYDLCVSIYGWMFWYVFATPCHTMISLGPFRFIVNLCNP